MKPRIVVVGSSNTDMILKLHRLPKPGETVIGGSFSMAHGGKGANQAVAAARAGGDVTFLSKLGNDALGREALQGFKREGVNTDFIGIDSSSPSGVAMIFVDERGENSIGVASGSNGEFRPSDLSQALDCIASADPLLVQLEIPFPTFESVIRIAAHAGVSVILNPAPACPISKDILGLVSFLTPNETEAEAMTGVALNSDSAIERAASSLLAAGVGTVVITLGSQGAYLLGRGINQRIAAFKVEPIDTTAAGDVFNGALAVALGEQSNLPEAVRFACAAAAISVTRLGAQPSAPTREEINRFMESRTHGAS